jgi:hypothetical protein
VAGAEPPAPAMKQESGSAPAQHVLMACEPTEVHSVQMYDAQAAAGEELMLGDWHY